jgi:hypothetical protein
MPNYFYVKSGLGTRTTDTGFTSPETGAFGSGNLTAANTYANLGVVAGLTTPPTDGDIVFVSSAHNATYDAGANVIFNNNGVLDAVGVKIVSVDDTDCTAYLPGASENLNDAADDYGFVNSGLMAGISLETGDDVITTFTRSLWRYIDGTITVDGNNDVGVFLSTDGARLVLEDVSIKGNAVNWDVFALNAGCVVEWRGGILGGTAQPGEFFHVVQSGISGGFTALFTDVDLSLFTGQIVPAFAVHNTDNFLIRFQNCKLNTSATIYTTLPTIQHRFEMFNCDDSVGGAFHRFLIADGAGQVANNDTVYVTASTPWYEGTDKSSLEVQTTSLCSHVQPFVFDLPAQYIDLSQASSDVISIDLVSDFTLTDTDIVASIIYPDGTAPLTSYLQHSTTPVTGSNSVDPIGTGTTLTNTGGLDATDWTGEPASPNFYRLSIDTSGNGGGPAGIIVKISVFKSGIDGTTGNKLFINPGIVVS